MYLIKVSHDFMEFYGGNEVLKKWVSCHIQ